MTEQELQEIRELFKAEATEDNAIRLLLAFPKLLDEVERLRKALEKIKYRYAGEYGGHISESEMREIARKALEGEE